MLTIRRFRLAPWGGFATLLLTVAPVLAQDGQAPVTRPTTAPETNAEARPAGIDPPLSQEGIPPEDRVLPPVPETSRDPAPPGTRGVRVDTPPGRAGLPNAAGRAGARLRGGRVPAGRRSAPGVSYAEGIVTSLGAPEEGMEHARLVLRIDTSRDWFDYALGSAPPTTAPGAASGEVNPVDPAAVTPVPAPPPAGARAATRGNVRTAGTPSDPAARAAEAAEKAAKAARDAARAAEKAAKGQDAADDEKANSKDEQDEQDEQDARPSEETPADGDEGDLEVIVTNRSHIFAFARSPEGYDLYGATTISSPSTSPSAAATAGTRGATGNPNRLPAAPRETNFTNIREGSFVAIRYRQVGDHQEVLNLSLIELPLDASGTGGSRGPGATLPDEAAPGATSAPGAPVRVPRVPDRPASPGLIQP